VVKLQVGDKLRTSALQWRMAYYGKTEAVCIY